ncbi:MAG: 50S ribosomal protein L9 [Candidatus Syntrophosphaera sp.]|nr:50S ribosomal protein L9 [Candidatus Syntrophosphaera sp.]
MKVILLNNLEKVGKKGEVVSVKRGFARNYLIPRNLALYATPQNMKQLSSIQSKAAEEEEKVLAELKKLDAQIRSLNLVFLRKVDENENMFGSVSEADISQKLAEQGLDIHKSLVLMEKHVKALGESLVQIRLHKDIVSELKITVEKENKELPPLDETPEPVETPEPEETPKEVEAEEAAEPEAEVSPEDLADDEI